MTAAESKAKRERFNEVRRRNPEMTAPELAERLNIRPKLAERWLTEERKAHTEARAA